VGQRQEAAANPQNASVLLFKSGSVALAQLQRKKKHQAIASKARGVRRNEAVQHGRPRLMVEEN
jgi:hypothetical protein